ncbi:hypothetical protein NKH55_01835 [Mesorhizobium opportunistum]|uniref:hypothetical protein n=1 Tax=Mesorhizobium opportunistum TaxID=593909 RepID=UPI00333B0CC2
MKGTKTGGRTAGTPNKVTASIKEAVTEAFEKAGGVDYLVKLSKDDPRTFCALVGKVIPLQVSGDPENPVGITFQTIYEAKP